jgi:RNA polymerase sigma-70 factor (ECF subfamily)
MEQIQEALKRLFQAEFSKMVSVITRLFGLPYIETAEDIVSDTFLQATESWTKKGIPPNPEAWLYVVAKQKTLSHFRRTKIFDTKVAPEVFLQEETRQRMARFQFSMEHIKDSQLQMMFAVCNPAIASEAQVGLALRILCGFTIEEIAEAFLSNKETINKRLFRAKEKLRSEQIKLEMPPDHEIDDRIDNVLHIIYLLFNEGYYSKTQNQILRKELCLEAMRLGMLLTEYDKTNLPKTNALLALMCFHASRFDARKRDNDLVLYAEQDETLWDEGLIRQGMHFLDLSAGGTEITAYHLEAKIASWHCIKEDSPEKWQDILASYDQLLQINYSSAVALNRIYALYKVKGVNIALAEALKLPHTNSHFYYLLLGELYKDIDHAAAKQHLEKAYRLAKTLLEKQHIKKTLIALA